MKALIIVDMQPTFCEGGEVPVTGGNAVAERIASYLSTASDHYQLIITTQDWHIDPGSHFSDTPDFVDTWPPHGVADSPNAQIHPLVRTALDDLPADMPIVAVKKGHYEAAYSGFEGVTDSGASLLDVLREHSITAVDVVGLAFSHCVSATALDADRAGIQATVFSDLSKAVSPETEETALRSLGEAAIPVVQSG